MKKILLSLAVVAACVGALAAKSDKEPILMTVNDRPVYKSEFEYLYNKNAGQQIQQQSLDDYVEMFVNYKLKVADALANHYDTTASYKKELAQYRNELAAPYMRDKAVEDQLLEEAYDRYLNLLNISHIMFALDQSTTEANVVMLADSIRNEILAGRLNWDDAAARYSIDGGSNRNGGKMGWMIPGRLPSPFEDMAYATPKGDISLPVNSGYGIHLIRVDGTKKNPGEVKARHILKLTARKSPEEAEKAKEQIDSIYTVLMNGADFAEVARAESEDPGSRANGGELDWFGTGMMVAPFDSAAFSMEEGIVSHPIQTSYGWHIIEVTGHRPPKTFDEIKEQLKSNIQNSEKGNLPQRRYLEQQMEKYNSRLVTENLDEIQALIAGNPEGYDSVMIVTLRTMSLPVAVAGNNEIPVSEAMKSVASTSSKDAANARALIQSAAKTLMERKTLELAQVDMMQTNPDYRNLVNEYSDGILLFDISQDKVWQKATNDRAGLEKYFEEHRNDYKFDEPRYKAVIVFTANDSIETEVKKYLDSLNPAEVNTATIGRDLRDKFGKHVRAERVIAKKGENAITDYLAFGAPKPEKTNISWSSYFPFMGQIIEQPVEPDDVRSKVTTDYQAQLESDWIKELRAKYPVKVDKKVLKTVKEIKPAENAPEAN